MRDLGIVQFITIPSKGELKRLQISSYVLIVLFGNWLLLLVSIKRKVIFSGSSGRILYTASWLCSQPNWYWSNPWTVGTNRWCHSRKEPHPLFWCGLPGTSFDCYKSFNQVTVQLLGNIFWLLFEISLWKLEEVIII